MEEVSLHWGCFCSVSSPVDLRLTRGSQGQHPLAAWHLGPNTPQQRSRQSQGRLCSRSPLKALRLPVEALEVQEYPKRKVETSEPGSSLGRGTEHAHNTACVLQVMCLTHLAT